MNDEQFDLTYLAWLGKRSGLWLIENPAERVSVNPFAIQLPPAN